MAQRINFNKQTLFIVGAGASLPYGYPLGAELVERIVATTNPQAAELIKRIRFHDPLSIDSFLAQHCAGEENKDLRNIGKQLIAEQILSCEDRDAISKKGQQIVYNKEAKSYERGNENWYRYLAHSMFEDKERLINEPLPFKIITFNYDVSLDYYLLERVWQATMLTDDEKREVLKKLKAAIIHVYGKVRKVPWDNPILTEWNIQKGSCDIYSVNNSNNNKITPLHPLHEYGFNQSLNERGIEQQATPYCYGSILANSHYHHYSDAPPKIKDVEHGKEFINKAAQRIHVIGEEREKVAELLIPFKQYIAEQAQRIMFLGFGFDNQNMDLLFDKGTQTLLSANYLKFISDELGINKEPIEISYTNYGDSEKLKRRIEEYFPKDRFRHFKSTKSVYAALMYDFDLS